jgi:endonuclease/exonuclease/phosphatase family metal-dependent hydrolase
MNRHVSLRVRALSAALLAATTLLLPSAVSAQTTVVINDPAYRVSDARIQGGASANTVFRDQPLATKIHPTNATYTRRSVLKFDTHNTIPAGATVQSATLTLTIAKSDPETRRLGVYRLSQTFDEGYATWYARKSATKWTSAGADLAEKFAEASVGTSAGSKVTFDVTTLVQRVVKGTYGSSRWMRIALVDLGSGSHTSYKEFYHSESTNTGARPVLKVVYGGTTSAPAPAPEPAPAPTTSTGTTLKVLHWNIHRGWGTDGKYNLDRIASWIVKMSPNIVSLNEVERYTSYANEDQPARLLSMLKAKTGAAWYLYYRTGTGSTNGHGNAILSRFPITSPSYCQLSSTRVLANVAIAVNGRLVNFYSTHLDSSTSTSTYRIAETKKLISCLGTDAEQKIVAGDFNARDYTYEIGLMEMPAYDSWAEAAADGTAVDYPGNTAFGATRNRRIDYVWLSKRATNVVLKGAKVFDTRDANGHMPSDHKPLLVTFTVK